MQPFPNYVWVSWVGLLRVQAAFAFNGFLVPLPASGLVFLGFGGALLAALSASFFAPLAACLFLTSLAFFQPK